MSTTETGTQLGHLEEEAAENLAQESGRLSADLAEAGDQAAGQKPEQEEEKSPPSLRMAVAVACPIVGSAIMLGGMFTGLSPRFFAAAAGLLGIGLVIVSVRIKSAWRSTVTILAGIGSIGLLMVAVEAPGRVFEIRNLIVNSVSSSDLLRPPVPFSLGWHAIVGWLMGVVGFQTAWVALSLKKPALALMLPLPVAAVAAISVPPVAQVASGLALLVLFALGLNLLSTGRAVGGEDEAQVPLSVQFRRMLRALPLVAGVTAAMYFISQTGFLFPDPLIDPAQEAQKPKTVPISEAEDRVLFEVNSSVSGPWRIGSLDVYDGKDWRLPPFAQSSIREVPSSGVVDPELNPGVLATFTMAGMGGAVLPTLPNTIGIRTKGPELAYDARNANIRLLTGQFEPGLVYDITAAGIPSTEELKQVGGQLPREVEQFTEIPEPPPAVRDLISQAPKTSKWEEFDFLRTYLLENVVAAGPGTPKSVTPERVADMISGSGEGSPFEIVAAQAMMARWVDIPSRIGYGFDGGDLVDDEVLQVRPVHGAAFVEVYFSDYKWLPVIGKPRQAKATTANTGEKRVESSILPSGDIAVRLVFPVITPAPGIFGKQVQRALLIIVPSVLTIILIYILYPAVRKGMIKSRRRSRAREAGPHARIALAYAEFRDLAADLGCYHPADTPLKFTQRFPSDEEHRELAWLTTRALWGDLKTSADDELALHAEELAGSLRRRIAQAQPPTLRAVATVSRLSLRQPWMNGDGHVGQS